jgi:membrane fusion protein, multidrug efflux system
MAARHQGTLIMSKPLLNSRLSPTLRSRLCRGLRLLPVLAAVGVVVAATAPSAAPAAAPVPVPSPRAPAVAPVSFAPPAAAAADPHTVRALLAPAQEILLSSQLAGRVQAVHVNLGDRFNKGAVLVRFDCDEQAARLKMSQSDRAAARESHEAKLRLQGLQQAGELEVSMAASQAEKAGAEVELYQAQLAQCSVEAPFSGRVVKLVAKPFQGATQGQPLLEIVSDGPLKLRLNTPGKWVGWLKRGTAFDVQIDETGRLYKARVTSINGRIDPVSQTIEIEGAVDQSAPELLPGMSGTARFTPPKS